MRTDAHECARAAVISLAPLMFALLLGSAGSNAAARGLSELKEVRAIVSCESLAAVDLKNMADTPAVVNGIAMITEWPIRLKATFDQGGLRAPPAQEIGLRAQHEN
jgi:hypothetical protein